MRRSFLIAACAFSTFAHAGTDKVGTTSAAFIKLGSGSRPAALADAYVAAADDASGLAYNPAGMSQMLAGEVSLTHTEWFRGLRYENLNAVFSLGDGGMIGTTINFLSIPSITRTEQIANTPDPSQNYREVGNFTPFDLQLGLAYSRPLYTNLLAGLNFKVLTQSIDDKSTVGLGMDVGAIYMLPTVKNLGLGLSVQNLGTPIKLKREAFELPMLFRLGASYRALSEKMLLLAEVDLPNDVAPVFACGLEYDFGGKFFPRVGYRYNSLFNPWTVGLGAKYDSLGVDLSIVPFGELGLTYRATLTFKFGEPGAELTSPLPFLSSNSSGKGAIIVPKISAPDKVTAWGIFIYDAGRPAKVVRQLQGRGPMLRQLVWDGKFNDGSAAIEGPYFALLSARYTTGKVINTKYLRLEVNNTPPQVDLSLDPISVNPQAGGEAFVPTQFKSSFKGRAVSRWRLEIIDPQGRVFRNQRGDGNPPEGLIWDGKGDAGDALISGQIYQARMWVMDPLGNEASNPSPISFRAVFR